MATNPPERQIPKPKISVIGWLLDSDPSIRWQVMRDLTDAPAEKVTPAMLAELYPRASAERPGTPGKERADVLACAR